MILFQKDWQRFPSAIIDYDTKNETFLRMAAVYKKMGIKNNAFHLSLLQPEIKALDPFSEELDLEQKTLISIECRYNPWYFFREVVRIPPVAGPMPVPFRANRGNLALIWCFFTHTDIALIQPRQTGKSVSTDTISDWLIYIGANNTTMSMLTKDDMLRKANVERLKKIRDNLPPYLNPKTKKDSDNQHEVTCRAYNNIYRTSVAQNTEASANNLGRGMTSPVFHIDEAPFIRHISTTLPAALASGSAAREEAKVWNRPYGNIFTTTAGKKDDRDGKFVYDMIHGGAVWTEQFLDASGPEQLKELVERNCSGRKLLVNATFSHRQLGFTDEWLYEAMRTANSYGEAADRDFFNVWTSGTQRSPLTTKLNEIIRQSEIEPKHTEISRDNYIFRWYIEEEEIPQRMKESQFIMGLDGSEAVGRDNIGIILLDVQDLSVVGAATCNETNLIRFGSFVAELMIKYKNILFIPERKSTGQTLIDILLIHLPRAGEDPFKRIYNRVVEEQTIRKTEFKEIQADTSRRSEDFYDRYKRLFGFNTTGDSRLLLYSSVLQNGAKRAGHLVHDRTLSQEIRALVEKNGRIDHAASGHDDMVIAWLLTHWTIIHGKHLDYYGIDVTRVNTSMALGARQLSNEEIMERQEQANIQKEIVQIYEQLKEEASDFVAQRLERRLIMLNTQYKPAEDDAFSIDALIKQAHEEREAKEMRRVRQDTPLDRNAIWGRRSGF